MNLKGINERSKKPRQLPIGHYWFDYRSHVEKDLKALTKVTSITDWQSSAGQKILRKIMVMETATGDQKDVYSC